MQHIIKRHGHEEEFNERKVYASCYAACLSSHIEHKKAEKICKEVCKDIKSWIKNKKIINSDDLFLKVASTLRKYNQNAAFMYATHRDIS